MAIGIEGWELAQPGDPLRRSRRTVEAPGAGEALVRVAACGVCHTDLGYAFDGVRTRHPLPLVLGHEIAGHVEAVGAGAEALLGKAVVVPAVIPCGTCSACRAGRGAICDAQVFPGSDVHGGFASHLLVPARGLCVVDEARLGQAGLALADLAVVADAVTTPYQAAVNAGLAAGDVAIVVGAGGVGGFAVQIAAALGAHVAAIDVDAERLRLAGEHGASLTLDGKGDAKAIRKSLVAWAKERGAPATQWKIFETSGSKPGQELAFSLLNPGAHLAVVGYTRDPGSFRLSNLMAFDATARGTWGCLPEHYPAAVELVLSGKVKLAAFVERRPMSTINAVFAELRAHTLKKRPVLIPDFA